MGVVRSRVEGGRALVDEALEVGVVAGDVVLDQGLELDGVEPVDADVDHVVGGLGRGEHRRHRQCTRELEK